MYIVGLQILFIVLVFAANSLQSVLFKYVTIIIFKGIIFKISKAPYSTVVVKVLLIGLTYYIQCSLHEWDIRYCKFSKTPAVTLQQNFMENRDQFFAVYNSVQQMYNVPFCLVLYTGIQYITSLFWQTVILSLCMVQTFTIKLPFKKIAQVVMLTWKLHVWHSNLSNKHAILTSPKGGIATPVSQRFNVSWVLIPFWNHAPV